MIDRVYVLVYRLYGCGRGDYQKEGNALANPHLLYWTFTIWSIGSCQNRIAIDQYHMTILRAHMSTHRGDVIYLEAVRWPVNCFTRSWSSYTFYTGKLIMHIYWTSMLWSIDSCQDRASADQYHLTVSRTWVSTHRGQVFLGQHSLTSVERLSYLRSDFVNVWRHARLVVPPVTHISFASIVHSEFSDDLMFVSRSCLAFSIIPRLIQPRRCHCICLERMF